AVGDLSLPRVAQYWGGQVTSPPVPIHVTVDQAPTIAITSPYSGQSFYVGQIVPIVASATDPDGTISKVEFFINGALAATVTKPPYTFNWAPSATGSYALTAKATDDAGVATTTSNAINVTVNTNAVPAVSLVLPQAGQSFAAGGSMNLVATASDSDGGISRVDFYASSTLVGSAYSRPFAFLWTNVSAGSYSLTAKAVDDRGAVTASAAVSVTVQNVALTITSPVNGASLASDFVLVTGTYQA